MFLILVFAILHLPSVAESFRDHLSDALRLKCEALPYRTAFADDRCYVAVIKQMENSEASAECASIFFGAKAVNDTPTEIFDAMMVDKSKFHAGSASTGSKHLICSYDNGYKCGGSETMSNGRCVLRAAKKMNFDAANTYCANLGMRLAAPDNDLDNRIVGEALAKDPAWVDKSLSRDNGFKWKQEKAYSQWSTCNFTLQCSKDMGSVVDKTGYWSIALKEYPMHVVCLKNAENPFTNKGASRSSYHESDVQVFPQPTGAACLLIKTCYAPTQTSTRHEILGKGTVETQRGCEVLCNSQQKCIAFSFKDNGLSSSCVLLSSPSNEVFNEPTTVFLKKTTGCVARTNLTAEFGVDPCIDAMVPSVFRGLGQMRICNYYKDRTYITRAIDACGRRITIDNDRWNWLEKAGDMWAYHYKFVKGNSLKVHIVAASCVSAGDKKCPCKPLRLLAVRDSPTYPATPDRVNPCTSTSSWMWADVEKDPSLGYGRTSMVHQPRILKCEAGMWMQWNKMDAQSNIWGITGAACYN